MISIKTSIKSLFPVALLLSVALVPVNYTMSMDDGAGVGADLVAPNPGQRRAEAVAPAAPDAAAVAQAQAAQQVQPQAAPVAPAAAPAAPAANAAQAAAQPAQPSLGARLGQRLVHAVSPFSPGKADLKPIADVVQRIPAAKNAPTLKRLIKSPLLQATGPLAAWCTAEEDEEVSITPVIFQLLNILGHKQLPDYLKQQAISREYNPEYVDCINLEQLNKLVQMDKFKETITTKELETIFNRRHLARVLKTEESKVPVDAIAELALAFIKLEKPQNIPVIDAKLGPFITLLEFEVTRARIVPLIKAALTNDRQKQALFVLNDMLGINLEDYFNIDNLVVVAQLVMEKKPVTKEQAEKILQSAWSKFLSETELVNFNELAILLTKWHALESGDKQQQIDKAINLAKIENDLGLHQGIFKQAANHRLPAVAQHAAMQELMEVPERAKTLVQQLQQAAPYITAPAAYLLGSACTSYFGFTTGAGVSLATLAAGYFGAKHLVNVNKKDGVITPTPKTYALACWAFRNYSKWSNSNGGAAAKALTELDKLNIACEDFIVSLTKEQKDILTVGNNRTTAEFLALAKENPHLFIKNNEVFVGTLKAEQRAKLHNVIAMKKQLAREAAIVFLNNQAQLAKAFIESLQPEQLGLVNANLLSLAEQNINLLNGEHRLLASLTEAQQVALRAAKAALIQANNANQQQ